MFTHNPEEAIYVADRIVIFFERPAVVSEIIPVDLPDLCRQSNPEFIRIVSR